MGLKEFLGTQSWKVSATNLHSERLVLATDDDEAPGLVAGPVDGHLHDLLRHLDSLFPQNVEGKKLDEKTQSPKTFENNLTFGFN